MKERVIKNVKRKSTGIILAIFFNFFAWTYTWKFDKSKFWAALILNFIGAIFIIFFPFTLMGTLLWCIIDMSVKDNDKFVNYDKYKCANEINSVKEEKTPTKNKKTANKSNFEISKSSKKSKPKLTLLGSFIFWGVVLLLGILAMFTLPGVNNDYKIIDTTNFIEENISIETTEQEDKKQVDSEIEGIISDKEYEKNIKPVKLSVFENNMYDTEVTFYNCLEKAKKYNNIQFCYQISYVHLRGVCVSRVALKNLDFEICDELDLIYKELNHLNIDHYYTKEAFPSINSYYCKENINKMLSKIDRMNLINENNNNQWDYVVEECLTELKEKNYLTLDLYGCDFGNFAQKNKDVNYCYFLGEEYISKCVESVEYIKLIDQIIIDGDISDCEKIPVDFYFKGSMYLWCLGRFNREKE